MIATKNNRTELVSISDYARLSDMEKINMISNCALFIEHFFDGEKSVSIYFLNGFFIEVTKENNCMVDIIPYKRGYTLNNAFANKEAIYEFAA